MQSSKRTFKLRTFASRTFASATFRGVGSTTVVLPSPQTFNVVDRAGRFDVIDRQGAFTSGNR